jgi:hypothetical protein
MVASAVQLGVPFPSYVVESNGPVPLSVNDTIVLKLGKGGASATAAAASGKRPPSAAVLPFKGTFGTGPCLEGGVSNTLPRSPSPSLSLSLALSLTLALTLTLSPSLSLTPLTHSLSLTLPPTRAHTCFLVWLSAMLWGTLLLSCGLLPALLLSW